MDKNYSWLLLWSFFPCKRKYLHLCPGFAFMRKTSIWRCICKGNLAQNCFYSRNYLHLHEHLGYVFWIFVFEEFCTWQTAENECNMHRISDAVFTQLSSCLENALLISCFFFLNCYYRRLQPGAIPISGKQAHRLRTLRRTSEMASNWCSSWKLSQVS